MIASGTWTMKKFSVGLTGGIGSGKTAAADMFAALGVSVIDTDQISHALTIAGGAAIAAISSQFGTDFLDEFGAMNRAKMRAHVFDNPNARARLESILHPLILAETEHMALNASSAYILFVVPLLIESGHWKKRVSRVLVIDCPEELQLARVIQRNGLSELQTRAIMAAQASREIRLAAADDIIVNDKNIAYLEEKVAQFHARYTVLANN